MILKAIKAGYQKLRTAFQATGHLLSAKIRRIFLGKPSDEMIDQLEETLYEADLGVETAVEVSEKIRGFLKESPEATADEVLGIIRQDLVLALNKHQEEPSIASSVKPHVIMLVGVNGSGKTTTAAKLAKRYHDEGKRVMLVAADTFRAAAIDQLSLWSQKIGIELVKGLPNSDPAAVVYDAITAAQSRQCDLVIIDTAGRLQNKTHLMKELEKIRRSCRKVSEGKPDETLLVIDATTGQNGIDQARTFHTYTPITGIILTKLDGTAKGGVVVAIHRKVGIPVRFIGLGEGEGDLQPFDAEDFVAALFG